MPPSDSRVRTDGQRVGLADVGSATATERWRMDTLTPLPGVLRVDLAEDVERFDEGFVARPGVDDEPLEHPRDRRVGVLLAPRVVEEVWIALALAAKRQVALALQARILL